MTNTLALDTNVLIEAANGAKASLDLLSTTKKFHIKVFVPRTAYDELAYLATRHVDADDSKRVKLKQLALKALSKLSHWGIEVGPLPSVGEKLIKDKIRNSVLAQGVVPKREVHDAAILVESAILEATVLVSQDYHLTGIRSTKEQKLKSLLSNVGLANPPVELPGTAQRRVMCCVKCEMG